jgi:hypothetical protein
MKGWSRFEGEIVCLMAACLWAQPLLAQQEQREKSKSAARANPLLFDTRVDQQDTDQGIQAMRPDNRPLSGVQNSTLGTPEMRHSYWVPGIEYSNTIRSNSLSPAANSAWNTTSFVSGDISLLEAWGHSLLSASYSGGGFSSTDPIQGNGQYHQLATAFEIDQRRWQMLFVDQFSYLPQSTNGFGGASGLALPGIVGALAVPLPGLQSTYVPNQTILTVNGPRYSNASAVQLTYAVSPRGSITLAGVYGTLRFIDSGNVNSDSDILNAGYNYAITRRDIIGLVYLFSAYRYPGDPQALGDHVAQLAYGRKITGRLALKLAGGPEVTTFRVPIGGSTQKIAGSGNAALTYAFARSSVALSYTHGVSGGSGVFTGSNIDQANVSWSRQLTRVWNGSVNFGYAKNRQILSVSGLTSPSYDTWLAGAGLSRALGRAANLSVAYQAQIQNSNVAICSNSNCGTNYTVHQVFLTFKWHTRPLMLK